MREKKPKIHLHSQEKCWQTFSFKWHTLDNIICEQHVL